MISALPGLRCVPLLAKWVGTLILDGMYPRVCCHCDALLEQAPDGQHADVKAPSHLWFCPGCQEDLAAIAAPYCSACGEPFEGAMDREFRCSNCTGRRLHLDFALAGYKITGAVREVVHHYKYGRKIALRAPLADMLMETFQDPRLASENLREWLLVPVPLHATRQMWRGFNQSWELCRQVSRLTGIPAANVLKRRYRTPAQAHLRRGQRLKNLKGAFALRRNWLRKPRLDLKGRKILLVDDVLTTGATANECAKVLKREAGAEKVVVITAARG